MSQRNSFAWPTTCRILTRVWAISSYVQVTMEVGGGGGIAFIKWLFFNSVSRLLDIEVQAYIWIQKSVCDHSTDLRLGADDRLQYFTHNTIVCLQKL